MGCPQSRLTDDRPVTTRDVDVRRSEPGLADAPDTAAKRTSTTDDERHETMSDRDFEADRARLAKARKKRLAVAVEALASDAAVTVVPKDEGAARLIMRAVRDNPLFEGLPDETRAVLVSSMTRVEVPAGHDIITQGDENAEHFYVLESGAATVRVKPDVDRGDDCNVSATTSGDIGEVSAFGDDIARDIGGVSNVSNDAGPVVATLRAGDAFGELALLYRCARAATVRASFDATLWALSRDVYVTVKRARETAARAFKRELVNNVKALRALDEPSRAKIADALKKATYERNERVVRKGDPGDRFFVVAEGALDVVDPDVVADMNGSSPMTTPTPTLGGKLLASLTAGDAFGERALTRRDDVRQATVTVSSAHADLYYLERDEFDALLGSYAHVRTWLAFRNVPALASVSDADLHEIARGVSTRRFNKGERVCAFGERADEMFVVESGCVSASASGKDFENEAISKTTPRRSNPRSRSTRCLLRPGEWFGERALMGAETTRAIEVTAGDDFENEDEDERPASASPEDVETTTLYVLRRSALESALGANLRTVQRNARLECVGDVSLLRVLDERTRSALADALRPVCVEPGGVVFEQGDEATENGDALYFVESGAIEISRDARVLTTATRGEHFGELALLNNEPRAAKATASNAGAFLLALSREDFDRAGGAAARAALEKAAEAAYGDVARGRNAFLSGQNPLSAAPLSSGFNVFGADPRLADFELRAVLGVGAFGKVYLAKHRASSAACAIKSLSKGQLLEARLHQHVLQERDAMRDVAESPHTVRLLGTFQDATKLYMCTEVVMGGELFNRLNRVGGTISERDAAFYAACVALGLEYMQRKHYVYRDLKPENLLVDERGYVKIADFGFAKRLMPGERAYTLCGTPEYMAPELFKQTGHDKGVDWWALGVLAYEMVLGSPPFYAPDGDGASQMRRVLSGKYAFPKGAHRTSPAFEDFVKKLLNPNSAKRLGCLRDGAADVKRHPWLAENADFRGIADGVAPAPWTPPLRARAGARGDGSDQDFDVSCFDEYDMDCEHPGAAYEFGSKSAKLKGRAGKEDVFAGF